MASDVGDGNGFDNPAARGESGRGNGMPSCGALQGGVPAVVEAHTVGHGGNCSHRG